MTTDTETPRIKYSPGLGGWTIYQGYEFINGAFAQRETAEIALAKLLAPVTVTEVATCEYPDCYEYVEDNETTCWKHTYDPFKD